jgi:hypothetical protein
MPDRFLCRVAVTCLLALAGPAATAAPLLRYFGGKVVSNPQVVQVYWTSSVSAASQSGLPGFYTAVLNSPYLDWVSEYSTVGVTPVDGQPGSNQRIGRGSFVGAFTITPSITATNLTNLQIRAELAAQIAAGKLPAPTTDAAGNVNTIYMVDFPPGYTIVVGTSQSCVTFCGAFDTMTVGGKSVGVGLIPEIATGPCAGGCGADAVAFNNVTAVHAHELLNIVTDLELPIAPSIARPVAWFSNQTNPVDNGDVADVCNGQHATIATFTVEKGWSNKFAACIASPPAPLPVCDGSTTYCRQCSAADNGQASGCSGARAVCETDSANAAVGECVACAKDSECAGVTPVCGKGGASNDTCRACAADSECAANAAGPHCLSTGACGALVAQDAGSGGVDAGTGGSSGGSKGGCSSTGTLPFLLAAAAIFARFLLRRRRA